MSVCSSSRRHPLAVDSVLAGFFVVLDTGMTVGGASWWPHHPGSVAWIVLAAQALACSALIVRRRFPLSVVAILAAFSLAVSLLAAAGALHPAHNNEVWAPYATVLAAYGPLFSGRTRRPIVIAAALGVLTLTVARPWQPSAMVITVALTRTAIGPLLALYFEARARLIRELTQRAERAERERTLLAEQARAEERTRLAAEMHDVVTHRISLMVLQAGALQVTAADPEIQRAADELRSTGCVALDELRDLVGILHTAGDAEPATAIGLEVLVAESIAVGTPVELSCEGDPALAAPVVARTTYRIVRETLTNVRKHAPGARVQIRVRYQNDRVQVTVANTSSTQALDPALAGSGTGMGIAGLRQRVELMHGTLRAGPTPDGGFRLDALLPAYVPTAESAV